MLLIMTAVGILGTILLGVRGLTGGSELDRILAIGCIFMAAAGVIGSWIDDGRSRTYSRLPREEWVQLLVGIPLMLFVIGVFVATLIPSIYVMLPVFAVWHYASKPRLEPEAAPPTHAPEPAYAR